MMRALRIIFAALAVLVCRAAGASTEQERGSMISMTSPGRSWLALPAGALGSIQRNSVLTYAAFRAFANSTPSTVVFRRTLSPLATRTGSRQVQGVPQ